MEELQDYLVQIDPLQLRIRSSKFGKIYTENLFKKINKYNGIIYIAKDKKSIVGMVAGIIEEFTKNDEIEIVHLKFARVEELIVNEKYRGKKIGSLLMDKIEKYFKNQKCDYIYVKVFEPNKKTHKLYEKLGYQDRMVDMMKKI